MDMDCAREAEGNNKNTFGGSLRPSFRAENTQATRFRAFDRFWLMRNRYTLACDSGASTMVTGQGQGKDCTHRMAPEPASAGDHHQPHQVTTISYDDKGRVLSKTVTAQ
jgi:hypothetical protein